MIEKVSVLDKGYIELIDQMPAENCDLAVVQAARVTHLEGTKGEEKDKKLIKYLMEHRHTSPFEQVEFKFRVYAPVVTYWHWVRHRTFNYNFQSGRYTPFEEKDFYIPTRWRLQSSKNHQGSSGFASDDVSKEFTLELEDIIHKSYETYQFALESGIAKEQARLFLPAWGTYYQAIIKGDLHNLMNFMRLRMSLDAQYEIRAYAIAMFTMLSALAPITMGLFFDSQIKPYYPEKYDFTKEH